MCPGRFRYLFHQAGILENKKRFLLSFPIFRANDHEIFPISAGYLYGQMLTNHLFYKAFQVISKLIDAYGVHFCSLANVR